MNATTTTASLAETLLLQFDLFARPVNVEALAAKLDIPIQRQHLDDDVSGFLFVKDKKPIIFVNSSHHVNRQRFTVAHEIGHHQLHHLPSEKSENLYVDRSFYRSNDSANKSGADAKMEKEANTFAAELLMPANLVRTYAKSAGIIFGDPAKMPDIDVYRLAMAFAVSDMTMEIRCRELAEAS